jgi:hypothetical protein
MARRVVGGSEDLKEWKASSEGIGVTVDILETFWRSAIRA